MTIAQNTMVSLELTPRQRQEVENAAGTSSSSVELPLLRLVALTLAAAAAGRDVLPVASSEDTIQQILHPERQDPDAPRTFTVVVPLVPDQQERIRQLTGRTISSFEIAPYEHAIRYREPWDATPEPIEIGRRIAVVPHGARPAADDRLVVSLPPARDAAAHGPWGTGRHPTTQIALTLLEEYARPGIRALDIGTGSGILAVAAARLGAAEVTAVDIDEDSVACARETADLNGLTGVIDVRYGSLEAASPPYDLVTMNVLPHVIMALAAEVRRSLHPGSALIVSGIPSERAADSVLHALRGAGFTLEAKRSLEDWIGCALRAPAGDRGT